MNKLALLAAATAAVAVATPAHAATVIFATDADGNAITNIELIERDGIFSGAFEAVVVGDTMTGGDPNFAADFTFETPFGGNALASAISTLLNAQSNINFTSISINGVVGSVINGNRDQAFTDAILVPGGVNTLRIAGMLNPPSGMGSAGFGGNVTFAGVNAVPEPATWAMFILGFGMLGYGLRRRNAQVRVSNARLTFA